MTNKPVVVFNCNNKIGECALWDEQSQCLFWLDILAKKFMRFDTESNHCKTYCLEQMIGALSLCKSGRLIIALQQGLFFYDLDKQTIEKIINPEDNKTENRFNDGKASPDGRFWVGSMQIDPQEAKGSLYRLDSDLSCHEKLKNITISNGITWSLDNKNMYYIDTPTNEIQEYSYDIITGNIEFIRNIVTVDGNSGHLDGMTIDENGNLWVAMYGGGAVNCFHGTTGELLISIELPTTNITSCTFGGKNLDTLFITSASNGLSQQQLANQPLAGALFKIELEIKGVQPFKFNDSQHLSNKTNNHEN